MPPHPFKAHIVIHKADHKLNMAASFWKHQSPHMIFQANQLKTQVLGPWEPFSLKPLHYPPEALVILYHTQPPYPMTEFCGLSGLHHYCSSGELSAAIFPLSIVGVAGCGHNTQKGRGRRTSCELEARLIHIAQKT